MKSCQRSDGWSTWLVARLDPRSITAKVYRRAQKTGSLVVREVCLDWADWLRQQHQEEAVLYRSETDRPGKPLLRRRNIPPKCAIACWTNRTPKDYSSPIARWSTPLRTNRRANRGASF